MLSFAVKRRRRANRAARKLSRTVAGRQMVKRAKAGCTQELLSSKHLVAHDELSTIEQQTLALFDKYVEHNPGAWQTGFKEND